MTGESDQFRRAAAALARSRRRSTRTLLTRALVLRARVDNPLATLVVHPTARLGPGFVLSAPSGGLLEIGPGVDIRRGFECELGPDARVTLGTRFVSTFNFIVQCSTTVDIGADAIVGQDALIADGSHRFRDPDVPFLQQGYEFRPITIGQGAVLHSKCTVTANLGERAVVGANSLVTRPVPAFCLASGVPARVIEYFGPPDRRPADLTV